MYFNISFFNQKQKLFPAYSIAQRCRVIVLEMLYNSLLTNAWKTFITNINTGDFLSFIKRYLRKKGV